MNEWIFLHLQPQACDNLLDLGCGTGKQSIPLAKIVGKNGHITAVDISEESLTVLRSAAEREGLEERITTYHCDMDEFGQDFISECYDRVVASFSLYYTSNPSWVIREVHRVVKSSGVFFFCGPIAHNNYELKSFLSTLPGKISYDVAAVPTFMEKVGPQLVESLFERVEKFEFNNPLHFDSAEALYTYWSAHNLYERSLDSKFKAAASQYFGKNAVFTNVKRVIGIKATK